jgi:fibronectin-binding autotransporter adhesin
LTGSGRISGAGGFLKTNAGVLSIEGVHDYTGPTVLAGGVLAVSQVANGASPSGLGAAGSDPTNLVINGATLRYVGPSAGTDRGATLLGPGGTIDVAAQETVLTASGLIAGPGTLTKSGPGFLTLAAANTFTGGTVIREGALALGSQAANSAAGLSALGPTNCPVTFDGGALELFGFNGGNNVNYNTLFNPLLVPAGQTGTLRLFQRGPTDNTGLRSSLAGAGVLELVVSYVRGSLDGDWSSREWPMLTCASTIPPAFPRPPSSSMTASTCTAMAGPMPRPRLAN